MKIDWRSLCIQGDSTFGDKVVSYEFTGRKFYERANAVYDDIDLLPSSLLYPENDLYPEGDY